MSRMAPSKIQSGFCKFRKEAAQSKGEGAPEAVVGRDGEGRLLCCVPRGGGD